MEKGEIMMHILASMMLILKKCINFSSATAHYFFSIV